MGKGAEQKTIVIDNGSYQIKAGFAGADENQPTCVFRSFVGVPTERGVATVNGTYAGDPRYKVPSSERHVGVRHTRRCGPLECRQAISKGKFEDKDVAYELCKHAFKSLGADSEEHAVLLTDAPLGRRIYQEMMCEVMFESFNTPKLYIADQAALSMLAVGATTGIVLQSGYEITRSVPIYEGYALPQATIEGSLGGRDLTEFMMCLDWDSQHGVRLEDYVRPSMKQELVREIKETVCYVADEYGNEDEHSHSQSAKDHYTLPDGRGLIQFNSHYAGSRKSLRWQCPEYLFKKGGMQKGIAIDDMIVKSISRCDVDLRKDLYKNVILSGGNTMFAGIEDRLEAELSQHSGRNSVNVVADIKYHFGSKTHRAWVGGSVYASLSVFEDFCLAKDDWEEFGNSLVHRKFA